VNVGLWSVVIFFGQTTNNKEGFVKAAATESIPSTTKETGRSFLRPDKNLIKYSGMHIVETNFTGGRLDSLISGPTQDGTEGALIISPNVTCMTICKYTHTAAIRPFLLLGIFSLI
jgi:hypothetical protein